MTAAEMKWLPSSCAYRLRAESKPLPEWHPLISGHVSTVFKDPNRIRGRVVSETEVPEETLRITSSDGSMPDPVLLLSLSSCGE